MNRYQTLPESFTAYQTTFLEQFDLPLKTADDGEDTRSDVSHSTLRSTRGWKEAEATSGYIGDHYVISQKRLGKGQFAEVRTVTHKSSQRLRAVKQFSIHKLGKKLEQVKEMAGLLKELGPHRHIARLFDNFQDKIHYYLIFELCAGGSLFTLVKECRGCGLTERESAGIIFQLLRAVEYMHSKFICHQNICLEHVLLKEPGVLTRCNVKVIDFGSARVFERRREPYSEHDRERASTRHFYQSPQVKSNCYTESCDVWACGVILHVLLLGLPSQIKQLCLFDLTADTVGSFSFNRSEEDAAVCSPDACNVLASLLAWDEEKRVQAEDAVKHEWVFRQASQADIRRRWGQGPDCEARRQWAQPPPDIVAPCWGDIKSFDVDEDLLD